MKILRLLIPFLVLALSACLFSCKSTINDPNQQNNTPPNPSESTDESYSSDWSYNNEAHWHACTTPGKWNLKKDEEAHTDSNEKIIKPSTDTETGLAEYTCSVCGHTYQKIIYLKTTIVSLPSIDASVVYIGQPLSTIPLSGGEGSVKGSFSWATPDELVTTSGDYKVIFTPNETAVYETLETTIKIEAYQLTISISSGENGNASPEGVINVDYNSSLDVSFIPDEGYMVDKVTIDESVASCTKYTFSSITEPHSLDVTFKEATALPYTITCLSGTPSCYTIADNSIAFGSISENSVYSISGYLEGNIIIDVGENYNFELQLHGFTLTSEATNPITILSAKNVDLKAKLGTENFIYDNREAIDEADTTKYSASIYSLCDLDICGQGKLTLISANNNGIHTKDDLVIKNLTLSVTCVDNALKGNDSVTITSAKTTLISTQGDCIKTTNSDISTTNSKQRGIVTIAGGTHKLYAACDGIDSSYDVIIDDASTSIDIYTDKYSSYSDEITTIEESVYYIRYSSNSYSYSIKYLNSDTDYVWENAEYHSSAQGGRSTYYYYSVPKRAEYSSFVLYIYSSSQAQCQDGDYYACSDALSHNDNYDTLAISNRQGSLSLGWTSFSSGSFGGMGGMNEGNSDKGTYSTKGIKASNQITINNGTINIEAYDDAIHANNDVTLENGQAPLGNVTINGGTITVSSNDDGLHADGTLSITNGNVTVSSSYEGFEGAFISISGGKSSINSKDDGINGASTSSASITISGGEIYIYCTGDGIDSNSTASNGGIVFSGGKTVVICNSNGNSAIDTERGYSHTGGYVLAIMSSGGMTSESSNGSSTKMTTKSSLSFSSGAFATVSVNGSTIVTVRIPCSLNAYAVYLGSSSATISSLDTSSANLDANGVCWNN